MDIPSNDDGLKWFGEGFDGFPKRLPDDCVEYIIHLIDDEKRQENNVIAVRAQLNQILKSANELKKSLLKDYIWQREAFDLKLYPQVEAPQPQQSSKSPRGPYLKGRTNFGDSIADEWLIVYILLELSRKHPGAWIRIYDTDGEFLLIEAANALPKWLNPDVAENRVWISNGHLRIIPLSSTGEDRRNLSLQQALHFIRTSPDQLIISPFIEDEAFHRIRDYPAAISSSFHNATITIPRSLAYILHHKPAFITPAIEAFYLRDPVALKPLATKDTSTLQIPPEDFVTTSVKFSKVGYAQLRSQVFDPPPAWTGVLPKIKAGDTKMDTGVKLACGFEMMLQDEAMKDRQEVRGINIMLEDVANGDEDLPTNAEIAAWPQAQDDEKWLDIDYNDFENELSGRNKKGGKAGNSAGTGFGDANAQENLRKMVSRFEDFLNDDDAGADGFDDDDDDSTDSETSLSDGEDKDASFDEAEFERAMKEMMGMPPEEIERNGLLEEARKLALEDADETGSIDNQNMDEDEEMRKVMELMEQELKGHGALELNDGVLKKTKTSTSKSTQNMQKKNVFFGPERPPAMQPNAKLEDSADEEIGPGDGELSSDDEEFNDVDLGLAKNMLESFKGQSGLSGPAGNMMRALGVNMPRDEGDGD
jgi:hypothetical protein